MSPDFPARDDGKVSLMCEVAVDAAKQALKYAKLEASDIYLVMVAAKGLIQRFQWSYKVH